MNVMRWRYGDTNPIIQPVKAGWIYEIGDLVFRDLDGFVLPAEAMDVAPSELRLKFHDWFLGVAMQSSPSGDERPIRVATTGVFEFSCPVMTAEIGDPIGPGLTPEEHELLDQSVDKVGSFVESIGACAKKVWPATDRLLVEIRSTIMRRVQHS